MYFRFHGEFHHSKYSFGLIMTHLVLSYFRIRNISSLEWLQPMMHLIKAAEKEAGFNIPSLRFCLSLLSTVQVKLGKLCKGMAFWVQMGFDILSVNRNGLSSYNVSHSFPVVKIKWKPQTYRCLFASRHTKEFHIQLLLWILFYSFLFQFIASLQGLINDLSSQWLFCTYFFSWLRAGNITFNIPLEVAKAGIFIFPRVHKVGKFYDFFIFYFF